MFDQLVPPHIILPKESNKQLFFLDNFKGRRHSIPFNIHKHTGEGLPNNEFKINYILNEQGFRCKNFKNDADLVTLGCSFTFGWGLEKEHMWSNLLSEKINMKVANLSFVGDSIQNQILNFLNYLQYYKKPKVLVALFPLNRISFPEGTWYKDKLKTKQIKGYAHEEFTHTAIATSIIAGHADAGMGLQFTAKEFGLGFIPLETEIFYLAMDAKLKANKTITAFIKSIQNRSNKTSGYEAIKK